MIRLERQQLERHVDFLFGSQKYLGLAGLGLQVKHAFLHRAVDLVNELKMAPLARVRDWSKIRSQEYLCLSPNYLNILISDACICEIT